MKNIIIKEKKTLKLDNVIERRLNEEDLKTISPDKIITLLNTQLMSKGAKPVGPLINHTKAEGGHNYISFILQADRQVNVDSPYQFKSQQTIKNCLFARFEGLEFNIDYAYQKLNVYAYENNIELKPESYSVVTSPVDKKGEISVDIFMPVKR